MKGRFYMKKIIAILMCLVFTLTIMSCAASEEEIIPEYNSRVSGDIDLLGKTFVYGMEQSYFFEGADSTLGYINTTEFADLAAKRLDDVENKLNCKIEIRYESDAAQSAYYTVATGERTFDFIQDESYSLTNYAISGIFYDLSILENINATNEEKWGSRYLLSPMMWNGALYGVVPVQHPLKAENSPTGIIAVNESMIRTLGLVDPRDYFENDNWIYSTFTDCLLNYAHTNNSGDYVYSFITSGDGWLYRTASFSNGGELVTINDDGTYDMGLFSSNVLVALEQVYEWMTGPTGNNIMYVGSTVTEDNLNDGNGVMALIDAYQVLSGTSSVAYNLDDFGIVPFPSGPNVEPGTFKTSFESADFVVSIPISVDDPEQSALVLDYIYEPFEGYETKEAVLDYLTRNYFHDDRDAEFFTSITDKDHTFYFDFLHGIQGQIMGMHSNTKTPVEYLDSIRDQHSSLIEQYVLPVYKTINELYE